MTEPRVALEQLDHDIVQIDLMYGASPRMCAGYLITKPVPVLIETGPKPSIPYILAALKHLHVSPEALRYVIVSHIHLDHAGGAGTLLQHCPNATLLVHEKGSRHLIDPTKLVAGTRQVYGDVFDTLLEGADPVPQERIHSPGDGEILDLGQGRKLTFIDTPGHAYHHFCVYDSCSQGIFCGDTAGISFPVLGELGAEYYLPSTSPTQFNPQAMFQSLNRLAEFKPRCLFFTHFGMASNAALILRNIRALLDQWLVIATMTYATRRKWQDIESALWRYHERELNERGIPSTHPALAWVRETLEISAKGLAHYLDTAEKELKTTQRN